MSEVFSDMTREIKRLERKIRELRKKSYLPEAMVSVVSLVADLQLKALPQVGFTDAGTLELPEALVATVATAERHAQGQPLLALHDFPVDMTVAEEVARAIVSALEKDVPELAAQAKELASALDGGACSLQDACEAILKDRPEYFADWEKKHPDAPSFLRFAAKSAVMPSCMAVTALLGKQHDNTRVWSHGHCPICGGQPLMGELTGQEGVRMHTCSCCAYEYRAPRLGCPFCLTVDAAHSQYFVSEDEPGYQLDVCGNCNNYIKIADFRKLDKVYLPMLDDLESLTLDLYARQMGYTRPTLSAWGF